VSEDSSRAVPCRCRRPALTCAEKWRPYRSLTTSYLFSAFEPAEAPPVAQRGIG